MDLVKKEDFNLCWIFVQLFDVVKREETLQNVINSGYFMYCTVLYCIVLYCTVLYCTVLYCTVLYCTVLYCTAGLGHPVYSGWLNLDVNRQSFHCFLVPAVYLGSYLFDLEWRKFLQGSIQYLNNMHRLYIYWVPLISIVLKTVLSQ